jgi:hypothetical protein
MTSPIGSSNPEPTFSLPTPTGGRGKNPGTEGSAANPANSHIPPQTGRPAPIGPLGHNLDTSA